MKRISWLIVWGILIGGACSGCRPPVRSVHNLVLTGSTGMEPLLREIGKRFDAAHPDVRVDVQGGGSTRGVTDVRQGLADIGMVARPLKPDETSLHATAIARDGVCFIVNRANPVTTLSDDQIVQIYTRSVSSWKPVGGAEETITLIHMAEGRALLQLFLDHFKLKSTQIRADAVIMESEQGIQAVAARPGAIAYVSCSRVQSVGENMPIRVLPSAGIAPTPEHVRDGTYPLSRPLNLITRDTPSGPVKDFIDFARSDAVADLVQKYHYIALER